jgi:undecaprenyl-diphosphatase
MWTLSAIGRGGTIWLAIEAAVAWWRSKWSDFAALAVALLITTIAADRIVKPVVHRMRPFDAIPGVAVIGGRPHDPSFPSGHAANAFAGAVLLSSTSPRGRMAWLAIAVAIAYSRVYLGVHYPSDVAGGALIGAVCGAAVVFVRAHRRW